MVGRGLVCWPVFWLCSGAPALPEDQALHVEGDVRHADLGPRPGNADGSDEQPHAVLHLGEGMLDMGADLRSGRIVWIGMQN